MGPPVDEFGFWNGEGDLKLCASSGNGREEALQTPYLGPCQLLRVFSFFFFFFSFL